MSNDTFIREVNEEMRQAQARALWERFGPWALIAAVVVVLGTGAWVGYDYWISSKANASGDAYSQALELANGGKQDEALEALRKLEADGHGAYPILARLRAATVLADKGDHEAAVKEFDAVIADGGVPAAIRDMARLRAGYILVDTGTYQDVSSRLEVLAADGNPLRNSAREALGLSAWKENKPKEALAFFDQIVGDEAAPRNVRDRATMLAELIRGSGDAT
ncbi:MAG: tetratricopeptide repeat protein [Rhizobiaceae bacterium]|nr:tetratricopeptide repeat protein [Rhizobiaceae bacterium]